MPVIQSITNQFAENAAHLWLLRSRAVVAPHFDLDDLRELDNRLEAHLDGLRVSGGDGWQAARTQLEEYPEPGELFAAAVLAFEAGLPERIDFVVHKAGMNGKMLRAMASAVGWLPAAAAVVPIRLLLAADAPSLQRAGLMAARVHRHNPGGYTIDRALHDPDRALRAAALRTIGELGLAALPTLRRHFSDSDQSCRFWAWWSAARLGEKSVNGELQMIAQAGPAHRLAAVDMAVRVLDPGTAGRWLTMLRELPGGARLAIQGFARLGDSAPVPRLIDAMRTPALARVAGEALTFITGVDFVVSKLNAPRPKDFEAGPTEDPTDENVALDPDENLPWPDPAGVAAWWSKNRNVFPPGKRLLLGKPITADWLHEVLRIGKQRQRAAAAVELAIREPNKPMFNVQAPGFRQ
jgi:uncharacterized protein (TIGR02270 family)